ncbi:DUF871 domain-containing protein [Virgibacillus sp. NKC19-16]|uniref:DUF871 domain-containing protein n=1 Tax=Virgibacillus salidurans TaxID=2831673 RepID=UPI001F24D939|nr:MupG family TIM beta-alpha barrel fold protein [Virgibacillus sp. NKC19-16]UJL46104.1 DUF871 domain-containing protein [Virgibacillus sp. NKC19-16]
MLGISIYLSNLSIDQQETYIKKMNQLGFTSIFTSLHIPEDNPETYKESLSKLGKLAIKYNMELIADISPESLDYLGFSWDNADQLKEWGLTGLRIDYGISDETIAQLSHKMIVALNASTITSENITHLRKYGANFSSLEAWHNYYPRPETGLGVEDFNEKNHFLKSEGIKVMTFIPGDGEQRGPLFQGLPTIEAHRGQSTFSSFMELQHNPWVDKIFIGDPSVGDMSEDKFANYTDRTVLVRAKSFTSNQRVKKSLEVKQTNRLDAARDVIRSAESRQYGLIGDLPVEPHHTVVRKEGSITVDNENYGRYQGEIQITKRTLPADEKVNVIGQVMEEDRPLLPFIKGGMAFQIEWVE